MKNINEEIHVAISDSKRDLLHISDSKRDLLHISDSKRDLLHRVWHKDKTPPIVKWGICDRVNDILVIPVNQFYHSAYMDINAHIETQMHRS